MVLITCSLSMAVFMFDPIQTNFTMIYLPSFSYLCSICYYYSSSIVFNPIQNYFTNKISIFLPTFYFTIIKYFHFLFEYIWARSWLLLILVRFELFLRIKEPQEVSLLNSSIKQQQKWSTMSRISNTKSGVHIQNTMLCMD